MIRLIMIIKNIVTGKYEIFDYSTSTKRDFLMLYMKRKYDFWKRDQDEYYSNELKNKLKDHLHRIK